MIVLRVIGTFFFIAIGGILVIILPNVTSIILTTREPINTFNLALVYSYLALVLGGPASMWIGLCAAISLAIYKKIHISALGFGMLMIAIGCMVVAYYFKDDAFLSNIFNTSYINQSLIATLIIGFLARRLFDIKKTSTAIDFGSITIGKLIIIYIALMVLAFLPLLLLQLTQANLTLYFIKASIYDSHDITQNQPMQQLAVYNTHDFLVFSISALFIGCAIYRHKQLDLKTVTLPLFGIIALIKILILGYWIQAMPSGYADLSILIQSIPHTIVIAPAIPTACLCFALWCMQFYNWKR